MNMYDFEEFQYPYKKVKGQYDYLIQCNKEDNLLMLIDLIVTFLASGQRPHHIEADINRNLHAFGKQGFFLGDIQILQRWCSSL